MGAPETGHAVIQVRSAALCQKASHHGPPHHRERAHAAFERRDEEVAAPWSA